MANQFEADTLTALLARAQAFGVAESVPIAHPNVSYTPNASDTYIAVNVAPIATPTRFLDGDREMIGVFLARIEAPKGTGSIAAATLAGKLAEHYPYNLQLVQGSAKVKVMDTPQMQPPFVTDERYIMPVRIRFHATQI